MNWEELQQLKIDVIELLKNRNVTSSEALYISSEISLMANMSAMTSILSIEENKTN